MISGIEVVLPDVRAVLGLDALAGDARPDHLRQAVDVDGVHVERLLDLVAHGVGPRLGAEQAHLQAAAAGVDLDAAELVQQRQHVGRRHHDDVGLEVAHQLDLTLRHAAGHRDDGAAQPLGAVVGAQPAGEQAVAIGDVDLHARPGAGGAQRAGDDVGPHVDVALGVAHHRRPAGGAGRSVDAHHLRLRHREHAEGIGVAQVLLGGEGKLAKVGQRLEVVGMDAGGVELGAVMRDVLVGVAHRPLETAELQAPTARRARRFRSAQGRPDAARGPAW